jgi:hypothetical protein
MKRRACRVEGEFRGCNAVVRANNTVKTIEAILEFSHAMDPSSLLFLQHETRNVSSTMSEYNGTCYLASHVSDSQRRAHMQL